MIDVKEAADRAKGFARDFLGDLNFSVEEIERDVYKGRDVWILTLGFPKARDYTPASAQWQSISDVFRPLDRAYKTFLVDAETGEVLAMKLREVSVP